MNAPRCVQSQLRARNRTWHHNAIYGGTTDLYEGPYVIALTRVGGASRMLAVVDTGIALMLFAICDCKNLRPKMTGDLHLVRRPSTADYGVTSTTVSEEKQIDELKRRCLTTVVKSCISWPTGRTGK